MSDNRHTGREAQAGFFGILPDDLTDYADTVADWKMSSVEHEMEQDPETYPEYARAMAEREAAETQLIQARNCPRMEVDQLVCAMTSYSAALAIEMYKRGVLDGGRIYHAFVTGELPRKGEDS